MAHSITVRLNKPAREFQAGENIGFNIRAGVQYYDRQTKKKITGENIRVDVYQGQNGQSITLELLNAKIGFATSGNSQQQQSSNHQNHPEYDDSIPF
ncbi:hypothetical protein JHI64_002266 [Escherichia coli]|nr:hypothetical protein [Escherichia coli]